MAWRTKVWRMKVGRRLRTVALGLVLLTVGVASAQPVPDAAEHAAQGAGWLEQAQEALEAARPYPARVDDPRWQRVYTMGERALQENPRDLAALRFLAETYGALHWWIRSWERWRVYRVLGGELDEQALAALSEAGRKLAYARAQAGRVEEAEAYYRAVLELNPDDRTSYLALGRLYLAQGRPERAEPYLAAALAFDPQDAALAQELAAARRAASSVLGGGGDPGAPADFLRGLELYERGEAYQARLAFIAATEAAPEYAAAWAWLGRTRLEQGSYALATDAYARAVALEPENAEYRAGLAAARAGGGP